jgi:hypothetical protein
MLPFGASISCATWEKFACALHWIVQDRFCNPHLLHSLDDFLFLGHHQSDLCGETLAIFKNICDDIGVPIASEKTSEPTTKLTFLCIEFDTVEMVMKLPQDKLASLRQHIHLFLNSKKATLRSFQSLIGMLNFACKVIAPGRAFSRLID